MLVPQVPGPRLADKRFSPAGWAQLEEDHGVTDIDVLLVVAHKAPPYVS